MNKKELLKLLKSVPDDADIWVGIQDDSNPASKIKILETLKPDGTRVVTVTIVD